MKSALALMALGVAALPVAALAQTSVTIAETAPVVTLNVTESVEAAPDVATIGTGVQTRALTAQAAMQDNAAKTDKLIAALAKAGIARKDIQTSGITLSAQYDYSNQDGKPEGPRFIGYEASNQLTVKLRDIKKVGASLDAMVAAGATSISGPTFSIDDPSPLIVQARGTALRSAKAQADYYAQAAGFRTARLVSISESSSGGQPPMPMLQSARFKADAAPTTPVEPGQVSASVTLTVQYALDK
ncbi:SIMPL domain-containing protein [Sphingobium sp. HBC34]|uniref:SIMPL domain-containing protein n=1 Tax=Sphingobium cyanobacteriorum TaxID=3063954 RepID=A0ABT8ZQ90_9SPHN|nr:SIMPL domain-containing protein [Sphingobium sp. HBC34]MDO7836243.1 SIMPL domain-containing protein [Sphingobium sp. HBC34]